MKPIIPKDKKIKSTLWWRAGRRSTAATQSQSPAVVKSNMFLKWYPWKQRLHQKNWKMLWKSYFSKKSQQMTTKVSKSYSVQRVITFDLLKLFTFIHVYTCCTNFCTKTTIRSTSSVNGRQFSIINNNDLNWTSSDLIYVITWTETNCGMQYVGQTGWSLKTRFREHFRKMKKPKKFDTFFYRHFKNKGHSPCKIVIQQIEKLYMIQIHQLD